MFIELFESFDKPYKFEPYNITKTDKQYGFETSQGEYYIVSMLMNSFDEDKTTLIAFETEDGNMGMTNKGDAFRVMATVIDIIKKEKKFLQKANIIHFEADSQDKGRQKLYARLGKMLAKDLNKKLFIRKQGGFVYVIADDESAVDRLMSPL
jgi:hypothetical protein